jgi:NAD(P)-dependent dehydrogenase (short-subunit alcohol dehydrogenase family)
MKWTTEKLESLKGKRILVTGGNSGLGFESIKVFVSFDAEIIMASRSIERGEKAKEEIVSEYPKADITVMPLDLADSTSIKAFAKDFISKYSKLDVLLNNAGIMTTPYGLTKDGLEQQQGVNHFGHFLLTSLLFDTLKDTKDSRIVNVSSIAHRGGRLNFKNLLFRDGKGYSKIKAYSNSKLENLLFTYELDRRVKEKGYAIKVLAAHPGVSETNLGRHLKGGFTNGVVSTFTKLFSHDKKYGALPQVVASVDKNVSSGEFYGPNGFMGMKGSPHLARSTRRSHNLEDAKKLWDVSEEVMGVKFTV